MFQDLVALFKDMLECHRCTGNEFCSRHYGALALWAQIYRGHIQAIAVILMVLALYFMLWPIQLKLMRSLS